MHIGNDASDHNVDGIRKAMAGSNFTYDDSMRDVLVDWWLLANVDIQRGYITSGFARSAAVASHSGRWDMAPPLECLAGDCCDGGFDTMAKCFAFGSAV